VLNLQRTCPVHYFFRAKIDRTEEKEFRMGGSAQMGKGVKYR